MTGEKVRDIGVGADVGQRVQQGVNGVRDLEGQVRVIAARPDGCLGKGAAEGCTNRCPAEKASGGTLAQPPPRLRLLAGPAHEALPRGPTNGSGASAMSQLEFLAGVTQYHLLDQHEVQTTPRELTPNDTRHHHRGDVGRRRCRIATISRAGFEN
jgi:hypothetical protein